MNALTDRLQWPLRRWWILIGLVFALQVAAIFWLSDNSPIIARPPAIAPTLHLSGNGSPELLTLNDPTLFALPHREAFSGEAWLKMQPAPTTSFAWTEPPRWLPAPTQELGAAFQRVHESYTFDPVQGGSRLEPDLTLPRIASDAAPAGHSTFRILGSLAARPLLTPIELPTWAHSDLLTNTLLKVLVNADGVPVSIGLLSSSGLKAADDLAREAIRGARFQSIAETGTHRNPNPLSQLTIGEILFEWQTIPLPATNSPATQ